MIDILYLIFILFIAYGTGKLFLGLLVKEAGSRLDDFIFSCGLGLALLGYSVYIIGSLGLLYLSYILIMLFVLALMAGYPFYRFISPLSGKTFFNRVANLSGFDKFLLALIIFISAICLFGVKAPPIGNDALSYHLYHPRLFIQNHKIGHIPFSRESMWPYLTEMLFTLGLILKSPPLAKMFHFLFGILSVLAVFSFTNRFFSKREALLAAALFYSAPGIFMQSGYAYVDLSLCFYSLVALYTMLLWSNKGQRGYLILSSIFTGLALSVKILGVWTAMALSAMMLFILISKRTTVKSMAKSFVIFMLWASAVSCLWYIRSYLVLDNPVYPFLSNIFKNGWPSVRDIGKYMGTRRDLIGFFRLPWDLVIHAGSFGGEQIGVIFLAFLPLALPVVFKKDILRPPAVFLFVYTIFWFWLDPNIRFAFVNFAIVFMLIGIGFYRTRQRYNLSFLKILLSLCLLFNASLCLYYNRDAIRLNLGLISKTDYLLNRERTFPVAEFVNRDLPLNSLLITVGEPRAYYFDRELLRYSIWQKVSSEDIAVYIDRLHRDNRPVYLLYRDDTDYQRFKPMIAAKRPIYEISREVDEGRIATYRIFKL